MDEDELAQAHAQSLSTHAPYDTFGSQAAADAAKAARAADQSTVPGLMPAGWIEPVADSIGASIDVRSSEPCSGKQGLQPAGPCKLCTGGKGMLEAAAAHAVFA